MAPAVAADLGWSAVTWPDLVRGVTAYRDRSAPQVAYLRCYRILRDDESMMARAGHSGDLVRFLNAWAARLDSKKAPAAFRGWITSHAGELERLDSIALTDPDVPGRGRDIDDLYDSLIGLRPVLRNMSDAAASKALHQLLPNLVVMWDKAIKRAATAQGYGTYSSFLAAMREMSLRLLDEAGMGVGEAELHLQRRLGYDTRLTFAKYVDEANLSWLAEAG
jgi:hypothetical protein